jgi:signal transduction histidine kinase
MGSLRARLAVAIVALVIGTLVLSGWVVTRRVVAPLAAEVRAAFADQAVFVAERLQRGEDEATLEERLGVEITTVPEPPDAGARRVRRAGRPLVVVPVDGPTVYVETSRGWIGVKSGVDLDRPGRRMRVWLPLAGVGLGLVAFGIAAAATRPLDESRRAMERVAQGDLGHRLDERGPAEIAALARSFNRMTGRVADLLRTERELLAGVSHELRSPLARLRLSIELLRDDGAPGARLTSMEGDVAALDALIGELLDLSRLDLGDRVLAEDDVDLRGVADEIAAREPRVAVSGHGQARGDGRLVARAVDNVVRNALAYSEGPVEVEVSPGRVEIRDRGPGAPPDAVDRWFEPFARGPSGGRRPDGLGLGLFVVRRVARLHGGDATASARPGGGLVFRLDFGLPPTHAAAGRAPTS